MSQWHRDRYGDPCRECGFDWPVNRDRCVALVQSAPVKYREIVHGATGAERIETLSWSVVEYVCHVADNLGIFAERLNRVVDGAPIDVVPYDPDELARIRQYSDTSLDVALQRLDVTVATWIEAISNSVPNAVLFRHAEFGDITLDDVVLGNAHDVRHHVLDIETILTRQL